MARRRSQARRKHQGKLAPFSRFVRRCLFIGFIAIALGAGYFGASFFRQMQDMPDVSIVERFEPIEAIQIFDRYDHLVCTVEGDEDRRVVPLNQIATQMQQAILAAEDHHFYEHKGINPVSIFRATLVNFYAGHVKEGGSTITQQLAKNLFFIDAGRTYDRKLKEAYTAWELERRYSKERILNMYLNQVYFGSNAYGIERAASRYFDKSAAQLSIGESAFLAGLVKAPSELGAPQNRKSAISRQREIIDKMVEYGYITKQQAEQAKQTPLAFKKGINPLQKYPYYISYVLELLRARFSQAEMRRQGLRVYTNLDPTAQELAEKTLNEGIKKAPKGVTQGALVSLSVRDAEVLAMVGGVGNFWKNQFNRATNPHTVGSSFKPFVYLTAFIKNTLAPDSTIDDTPLTISQPWGLTAYAPKNFDHKFYGRITVRRALALSRNVPAVKIGQMVGMESVIETARLAGLNAKLDPNLSLCLGSSAASPLDMAGAYGCFARFGISIKPQVLRKIENNRGQIIEVFEAKSDRAFQVEPVARLVDCMQDVVRWGTGTNAKLSDRPVAGKTGTADEGKDIWFIGFTPDMVTAVWGGNDENKPISGHNVTGGVIMAKIWHDYNEAYYKAIPTPPGNFMVPSPVDLDDLQKPGSTGKNGQPGGAVNNAPESAGTPAAATGEAITPADPAAREGSVENDKANTIPANGINENTEKSAPPVAPSPAPAPSTPATGTSPAPSPSPAPAPAGASPPSSGPASAPTPSNSGDSRLYPYNPPTLWMPVGEGQNKSGH